MNAPSDKILSLNDLAKSIAALKQEGKRVAHCHGCFDLLHIGHMKHFESAAREADVLVVTLTPDRYVNKGPGRPVFNERLRLESIAALEAVDFVALNDWPTAVETINLLKPDLYVKGPDYKKREEDITNNIGLEEAAVQAIGGRLHITDDVQFSSSRLIGAHMSPLDPSVKDYIADLKQRFKGDDVLAELDRAAGLKVLVIGDTIIDEYHYCTPLGKASKSPIISTRYEYGESFAGGVLAVANHLSQYCESVDMVTCLGMEASCEDLIASRLERNVKARYFYRKDGPTPVKRRYLDTYLDNKLFEVTFMNDRHIDTALENEIDQYLRDHIDRYDMVLVTDFGHGLITPALIARISAAKPFLAVNAQTNSNNYGFNYITRYPAAGYVSIDEKELRLPFGDNYGSLEDLVRKLGSGTKCDKVQITLGQAGSIYKEGDTFYRAPAFATLVKDSVGAGDAVLSVTSLLACQGTPPELIPFVGNCVGAMAVEIIGNKHPVYKDKLKKYISYFLK